GLESAGRDVLRRFEGRSCGYTAADVRDQDDRCRGGPNPGANSRREQKGAVMTSLLQAPMAGDWPTTMLMAVLEAGARGVLLLGAVLVLAMALRKASAATRHSVVGAGFVVSLLLPLGMTLPWKAELLPNVLGAFQSIGV